jgi:hypothetical protein
VHGLFADVSLRSAMSPGRMCTIDNRHVGEINALVMDFALLASLFAAISSAARSELMVQAPLFAILGAVMLIIYLLWYLFERNVSRRSRGEAALQALYICGADYAVVHHSKTELLMAEMGQKRQARNDRVTSADLPKAAL